MSPDSSPAALVRPATAGSRLFPTALLALAAGLVINTGCGPLVLDVIDYPISTSMENQLRGLELVSLALVVPWTCGAAVLAWKGRPGAPLVAMGPAAYTLYMFIQYVLGPEYGAYSWIVIFHVAMVTLSGGLVLWAWSQAQASALPVTSTRQRRRRAALLIGLAAFVLSRYLPAFTGATSGEPITAEFLSARTFYWSIFLLDLGVVVPATVTAAVGLLRGNSLGERAQYAVLGWFALVPPSVASMAGVMLVRDDPYASVPAFILLASAAALFAVVAGRVLWPLVRADGAHGPGRGQDAMATAERK